MAAKELSNVDDYVNVEEARQEQQEQSPPEEKKEPSRRPLVCKVAIFAGLVGLALLALVERMGVVRACGSGYIAPVWYFHTIRGQPLDVPAGTNCLGTAARRGQARLAEWVVDQGVANSSRLTLADGYSAAHLATLSGDNGAAVLAMLQRKGFPLGLRDKRGNTPCRLAASLGQASSVEVLCEAGECESKDAYLPAALGYLPVLKALDKCGVRFTKGKEKYTLASAAAEQNRTDVLEFLLEKGLDVNELNDDGSTAIQHAVKNNHHSCVHVLHAGGANLTVGEEKGFTPLMLAIAKDKGEMVDTLVSFGGQAVGVDMQFEAIKGHTPAILAAGLGREKILASLIRAGADPRKPSRESGATPAYAAAAGGHVRVLDVIAASNQGGGPDLFELPNVNKYTPLHIATQEGHVETVARLRELGVRVDRADLLGRTPQTVAVEYGHPELAETLFLALPAGEKRERMGWKMMEAAAEKGDLVTLRFLMGQGVPIDRRVKGEVDRLPILAARDGHLEALKFIVDNHPSLDLQGKKSERIALPAAMNGHLSVIKYLVGEKGVPVTASLVAVANLKGGEAMAEFMSGRADLDKPDADGDTPCQNAAIGGKLATITNLCSTGPHLHQRNQQNNRTLLFSACLHGHDKVAIALLDAGVDPDLPDTKGNTPAHASIQEGDNTAVLEAIAAHGGRLSLPNQNNFTPLHMAALKNRRRCTEYLAERVPLDTSDKDGDTPACVATAMGHTGVLRTLHRAGASLDLPCQKGYSLAHHAIRSSEVEALSYIIKHSSPEQLTGRLEGGGRQSPLDLAAEEGELRAVWALAKEGKVPLDVPNPATGLAPAAAASAKGQTLTKIAIESLMKEREGEEEGTDMGEETDDDGGATPEEGNEDDENGDEDRAKRLEELLALAALLKELSS